ncbi:microtubule-associated protein 4 isoform X3 [Cynocephalus volans]|uniref:microtubule-associated protein 4 isoform X3 n=1 Tax=Cynocephalus volans TaxID=110931 RepID=UPI002FC667EE
MADLSLADALTDPPPEIEEEIKRDFIATLEAEAFDDVVGETVGKTDYIPLLDVDEKTGNSESKKKPCSDTSQVEGSPSSKPTVLANGDHGIEGNDTTGSPTEFLEEKMAYQEYQNSQNWPEDTNLCFQPEQVVNPIQTDPFKMHHEDGLADLLFLSGRTTFTGQNDPLKDNYGMSPCDTFAPTAVIPQGWSVESPNTSHSGSFVSPEVITEPTQLTAELTKELEMASAEERSPTEAFEIMMGLKTTDMAPSRETEMALAKDMAPTTETEMVLAKDMELPTKSDVALAKDDMQPSTESDIALVKDMVLPIETKVAPVKDVVWPTETDVSSAKDITLFKETERAPPIKMDFVPHEGMVPPKEREIATAKGMVSLSEIEVALAKDMVSSTEISAEEVALSSETEMALAREMGLPPETKVVLTKDVALPLETEVAPVKDMALPPKTEMVLSKDVVLPPETEVAPVKDMAQLPEAEMALGKDVTTPPETEVDLNKDVAQFPETEMALSKDVASPPETEVTLIKDVPLPLETEVALVKDLAPYPGTEVALAKDEALLPGSEVALANNVSPAKDVAPLSGTKVAPVPFKDMEIAQIQEGMSEDSKLESLQDERQSAAPTFMISPEPVTAVGQKYNLPTDKDSLLEKLEQKEPFISPPSELSSETLGTLPTQAKQVCRPSDHRSVRPKPARVPPELLGGSPSQKTFDPRLGPCSLSELCWVSGSSSCGEPGNQRKSIHADFLEPQRNHGREAWDIESIPMMMKKKKRKPKQKRYCQPRAGGPWDDDNANEPKGHPFAADPQKSGALPSQPTTMGMDCGLVSRGSLKKECVVDSRAAQLVTDNIVSEGLRITLCRSEEPPKTAVNSQPKIRVEEEGKGNKSVPESQGKKLLQQDEYKAQPEPHLKTPVDKSQTVGPLNLKRTLTEVSTHKVETSLEIRPTEGCVPILDQEVMGEVSKPTAAKELPNLTPTLTASSPLENSLREENDESKMTKLQNVTQKEFPKEAEDIKELKKETFPKQRQDFASEQLQGQVLVQVPGLESEPFKRMSGDGKSRKGRGSSGKVRASSGNVRAESESPFLLDSQKHGRAVLGPCEPVPKTKGMTTEGKSEELGPDSSKQLETMADLTEAVVMGEPKEMTHTRVASTLIPLENGSGMTQNSGARTERGAIVKDMGLSNQSKEGKCPWMDQEVAPWISEKPKKRGNEGKNKKLRNNYSTQPARMEGKEEIFNPPFVGKDGDDGNSPHKNKELGLIFPKMHDPLFSHTSDTSTVEVVVRKGRNVEVNSVEFGVPGRNKTNTVKDSAVIEPAAKVTDGSCQDQIWVAGFVPLVLSEEGKADAAKGHTAVADKPNKRSNDGKNKKVKNSFPKKCILENKIDSTKIHVPMETTGDHRIEGMGYVDENRNITFTCPRTPSGLMNMSASLEALQSAACEIPPIPTPQVVKEGDSFPDTLVKSGEAPAQISKLLVVDHCKKVGVPGQEKPKTASIQESAACEKPTIPTLQVIKEGDFFPDTLANSGQETASAPISKLLIVDHCKKDGVPGQERPKAPHAEMPSTGTGGVALTLTAAIEAVNSLGDHCLKNKGKLADPMKNEAGIDEGHVVRESESVHSGASEHSVEKITELTKGHLLPGVPGEDQSVPGEVRVLEVYSDRACFPAYPVNKEKETEEGSVPVQIPDLMGEKAQNFSFCEDQNTEDRDSKGPDNLDKEMDMTFLPPKTEKDKLKEISLACKISELECVSLPEPEPKSDFLYGKVEAPPSGVEKLVITASRGLQCSEPKDEILEVPQKMTEKSEPKTLGDRKKEDKSRVAEPMKGYMRPTKSRGLTPVLPKSTIQERERSRPPKSSGIARPEEGRPAVSVTRNDITTPPNKELPPSPEKKTKPLATTQPAKTSTSKAKIQPTSLPKQPALTTSGGSNKKPMSLASGLVPAAPPKRPAAATARPSILPSRDTKPKPVAEAKVPEKRTSPSKPASALALRPGSKSTQTVPKATTAATLAAAGPSSRSPPTPLPKKPTAIKTEGKPADNKKMTAKSAPAELSHPKSTSTSSMKKNTTLAGAGPPAGVASTRIKSTPTPPRPSMPPPTDKKPTSAKPSSSAPRLSRLATNASALDLKNVRSKVGSTENIKHQPGGGRAKVEKKTEAAASARKPEPNAVTKTAGPIASAQKPPAGKVQIQNKKVDISKVSSKCGSKANIKHKPGGGDVKIESQKLNFKEKAQAKVGSLDNVGHLPAGGAVKTEGGGSEAPPCPGPPAGEEPTISEAAPEAGAPTSASSLSGHTTLSGGGDQREAQTLDTQIQETSI